MNSTEMKLKFPVLAFISATLILALLVSSSSGAQSSINNEVKQSV